MDETQTERIVRSMANLVLVKGIAYCREQVIIGTPTSHYQRDMVTTEPHSTKRVENLATAAGHRSLLVHVVRVTGGQYSHALQQ